MRAVETQSGLFLHDRGMASVSPYAQVMLNLAPLVRRFEKRRDQQNTEYEVARLFFLQNLRKSDICLELMMTRPRLDKILRRFSYRTSNRLNFHVSNQFCAESILLKNVGRLMQYLRRTSFRMLSLHRQWSKLRRKVEHFDKVGFKTYVRFLKQRLGFRYRAFERSYKDPDAKKILKVRKYVALFLTKLVRRDCVTIFFDSTSFSDSSFKKRMWTLNSRGTTKVNVKKVYGYVNLFAATTFDRILNYWVVKSVNSVTTASFLYETVRYCRNTLGYRKIVIFMDNARIHKTQLMKTLAAKLQVYFLLNAPYSSKINQVEYLFERIKRPFRRRNDKRTWIGLSRLVRNRMLEVGNTHLNHETKKFWKHMVEAVQCRKFWSKNN